MKNKEPAELKDLKSKNYNSEFQANRQINYSKIEKIESTQSENEEIIRQQIEQIA